MSVPKLCAEHDLLTLFADLQDCAVQGFRPEMHNTRDRERRRAPPTIPKLLGHVAPAILPYTLVIMTSLGLPCTPVAFKIARRDNLAASPLLISKPRPYAGWLRYFNLYIKVSEKIFWMDDIGNRHQADYYTQLLYSASSSGSIHSGPTRDQTDHLTHLLRFLCPFLPEVGRFMMGRKSTRQRYVRERNWMGCGGKERIPSCYMWTCESTRWIVGAEELKKSKPFAWDVFNMLHALAERNGGPGLEWGGIPTDRKDGPCANRIIVFFIT